MSFKITLPVSKILGAVHIPLILTCFAFESCNAQGYSDNGTYDWNHRYRIRNSAVAAITIGLSLLITLALIACYINRKALCGSSDPTQQNHSSNLPSNSNCQDVVLSFAGPGGQMMPVSVPASTFFQQDLSPPPPYHIAIHYPPLQLPACMKVEENSEASVESQNQNSNLSALATVSASVPISAPVARTTTTHSGMINPTFDGNV